MIVALPLVPRSTTGAPGVDVEIVMSTFAGTLAVKDTTPVKLLVLLTVRVKMIWLLTKFVCDELVDCMMKSGLCIRRL